MQIKLSAFEKEINHLTYALKKKGISKNHKVAFVAPTEWPIIALFFALFRLQAIAAPLSTRLPSLTPYLEALEPDFFLKPEDLSFSPAPLVSYQIEEEQIATLLFTSGSSGKAKIAAHSYSNHLYSAQGVNQTLSFGPEESWYLSLPLFHVSGIAILFRALAANATLILPPSPIEQATHLSLVPTQLFRLNKALSSTILIGGAPIPSSLLTKKYHLKTSYGLTEMSSTVTIDNTPLPFREIKLAPDGEILVRGKTLFQGYGSHPPFNKENWDEEGWFATRDLGKATEEGIAIIGRKDNLFISGGENIQPEEIEQALLNLPGIEQALIIPKADPEFGARPVAFIHSPTKEYTLNEVRTLLEQELPRFKLPIALFPLPKEQLLSKPSRSHLQALFNAL